MRPLKLKVSLLIPSEVVVALVVVRFTLVSVPVAVRLATDRLPEKRPLPCTASLKAADGDVVAMPSVLLKYDVPKTSKMLFAVVVALLPTMTTSDGSAG